VYCFLTFADRMSFANFMNSYKSPADVPENYRKHPSLSKSFKADGSYVRPAEDPVTIWAIARRYQGRVAFIMVEAMEPGKKFEGAILTSGTNTKIYRRDLEYPCALQEI